MNPHGSLYTDVKTTESAEKVPSDFAIRLRIETFDSKKTESELHSRETKSRLADMSLSFFEKIAESMSYRREFERNVYDC